MARITGGQVGMMGKTLRQGGGDQTLWYRVESLAATNGMVLVLDTISSAFVALGTRVYVTGTDADLTATLGHYTDDGSADPTLVDVDSVAAAIAFAAAGPVDYAVPIGTAGMVVPGGVVARGSASVYALALTFTNAGTVSALIAVTVRPVF